ncbi:telomerase inhibitor [Neodidymelliopsis sp. IMI 364377]|nr:telomerase inhibitor [Neodidymelliopsis sp. IMI 364377]
MGLAQQKNRSKISNDPQNTTWANNTERFGHKILAAQGWKAGDTLGAKDAAHEAHYTQASQSHIRVFLKDDNLGLGAKRGSERAENFGLAGLESILGRLNGREEEVKKEEARREEIEKRAYVYRKFGSMNFISGGFLVGDKIQPKAEVKLEPKIKEEPDSDDGASKKRKREVADAAEEDSAEQKLKRKKKSMDLREEADKQDKKSKKDRKEKKEKKDKSSKKSKKEKKSASSDPEPMSDDAPTSASDPEPLTDKARRKAEKKARKEEKKLKKALKKAAKEAKKSKDGADDSSSESDDDDDTTPSSSVPATGTSTPSFVPRGVQTARHRHIMMKKRASMDPQALKEIFMIKTPVA